MIKQQDKVWIENTTKEGRIVDEVEAPVIHDPLEDIPIPAPDQGLRFFRVRLSSRKIVILSNEEFICLHGEGRVAYECPLTYDNREEWVAANA